MSEETNDETTGTVAVTHANQLRSAKFKELMRKKSTWAWLLGLSILGGILGALVSPVIGLVAFVVVFLIVLAVVFGIADNRAEDAFYDYYCQSHGLIHVEMPEIVQHMASLQVELSGFRFLDGLEDKFRGSLERVTLESEAFDKRFEVFVDKGQDPVWVRRLFSPSFIVWLAENPPKSFAFELENGHLVAYVSKHMDDTAGLERVTEVGAYVAARLLEEVAQSSPRAERELNQ